MNTSPNPNGFNENPENGATPPVPPAPPAPPAEGAPVGQGMYFDNTAYYRAQGAPEQFEEPPNGMAVASLIVGLISLLFCGGCCPPLSIIGIVLAAIDRKKARRWRGMAVGGLVSSILSLLTAVTFVAVYVFLIFALAASGSTMTALPLLF